MKFDYKWNLSDGYPSKGVKYHGTTVMSTFACGGGSTMGYKLAGYEVVAANDIDPQMAKVYKANHKPRQFFECSIKDLLKRDDLPQVDVLDGSPPCSVFSMAGSREKAWQKDKMFREGQAKQILDDLFFDFVKLVEKMKPKIVIAENVKGMLIGNAKWYTQEVVRQLKELGYKVKVFLLNAATMGVPQKRQRVFFIAYKIGKDINLKYSEPIIPFYKIEDNTDTKEVVNRATRTYLGWKRSKPGQSFRNGIGDGGSMFGYTKLKRQLPIRSIVSSDGTYEWHDKYFRKLNKSELISASTFPEDYNYLDIKVKYLLGMSVPPVMMAQVAYQVYKQLIEVT